VGVSLTVNQILTGGGVGLGRLLLDIHPVKMGASLTAYWILTGGGVGLGGFLLNIHPSAFLGQPDSQFNIDFWWSRIRQILTKYSPSAWVCLTVSPILTGGGVGLGGFLLNIQLVYAWVSLTVYGILTGPIQYLLEVLLGPADR
jgi:hypothetical protein